MIIKAQLIYHTIKSYTKCAYCFNSIEVNTPNVTIFGMAETNDKPYTIKLHLDCITEKENPKLKPLLEKYAKYKEKEIQQRIINN